ncbi:hypothetical protein EJB05_37855, partial [Eragrostis curvula]
METMTTTTMLKPVYSIPHPLAGERVPLTVFDLAAFDIFVPTVRAYTAPAPSNEAIKEGLLKAVALLPHLAGRLAIDGHGRRFLHLNDEGVLVIEAAVSADLADLLAGGMDANFDDMYPTFPELTWFMNHDCLVLRASCRIYSELLMLENVGAALLQVKINRFRCGGVLIGTIAHHYLGDGHSFGIFFATWASAVREGKDFAVPSPPFLDRAATAVPRPTPAPVFDHSSGEEATTDAKSSHAAAVVVVPMDKIKSLTVHFTADFIADLKARVGARCSTFQCLLAHAWKKITAARDLKPEEVTQVRVAVNCRGRANPPVPMDFFGNMVLWAFPRLQVRELLNGSYGSVVAAIRDAVARVDAEYVQSFVDFGAVAEADGEELAATAPVAGTMLCPDLEVDSWLGFQFHQMDLGTGPPCVFQTPNLPVEGLMIFQPSRTAKGGVDLFIAVAEDHVDAFEQICHSLD